MAIRVNGMEFETVEEVKKAFDSGLIEKHDVVGTSPGEQPAHGVWYNQNVGGLFTRPGADPRMYHTVVMPTEMDFLSRLFRGTTTILNPEFDILSGVKALVGDPPADGCSTAPKAGFAKLCTLRAAFGEAYIETDQVQLNKVGGRVNNADVDRTLINGFQQFPLVPEPLARATNPNSQLGLAYFRAAVTIVREMVRVLFNGNYGSSSGIFKTEYNGFDNYMIENPTDVTGATCAAASSVVFNWNNVDVAGSVGGMDIVELLSLIMRQLEHLSATTGLPAMWEAVMDDDLFYLLTAIYPCSYLTNGCIVTNDSGERLNVDSAMQIAMRDEMRNGSFLWVNGKRLYVTQTTATPKTAYGAGFSSPIYIIPMMALGEKVTYLEGFDQANTQIQEFRNAGTPHYVTYNGGFYAETERQTGFCYEKLIGTQPRLIMRTPWLGARIENVNYNMPGDLYSRSYDPASPYHKNGGRYYNDLPNYASGSI